MADSECNNSAEDDVVELEAMRKDSFSWHPCQVSLSSRGLGLIMQYGDNSLEEMITDKQEVLARIRVRSTPLKDDDCSSLQQGDHVLATPNSQVKGLFYEARVEEVIRVRHSKRIHCRCSFTIKWLHQVLEEEAPTVPASAIMRLDRKKINLHPIISTFFSMLESSNGLSTSRCSTIVDMNLEMDINGLLEKQIEEISNSTDVSLKKISKNFVFGLEVDLEGQSHGMEIDASLKAPSITNPLLNNLKGSTGSENKQPTETIVESPPSYIPSTQLELTGSRSPLNPLAARAALASLRSKFPQNVELSVQSNVERVDITNEQSANELSYRSKCCGFSSVDPLSNSDDFLLKISATLGGKGSKFESIVKKLFPASSAPQVVDISNASSRAQVNGTEKKNKISEEMITHPSETRFTCSQTHRNNRMQESTRVTNTKETWLRSSKTRRVTRSTVECAGKIEVEEHNTSVEENSQTKCAKLDTSAQNTIALQNCLSDNWGLVALPVDGGTSICSPESDQNLLQNDGVIIKVGSQKGTFSEDAEKHNYPRRLTRSAARAEAEKNNLELEKSLTSPIASKVSEEFTEEREKNRNIFTHVKTTPTDAGSVVGSSQGTRQKFASSKKHETPETRFSERLRNLPRT